MELRLPTYISTFAYVIGMGSIKKLAHLDYTKVHSWERLDWQMTASKHSLRRTHVRILQ